ncbi:MAG: aminoacyl-tRNA hydrolase, partial [Candidatus Komeilibacteria bacterium]|nr:aminoacyl-tRNA hydrolase [Candidatus Komeilibacteria bacterium]
MKLIVGLGNVGQEYANCRHNFGFMVLDALSQDWQHSQKAQADYVKLKISNQLVELIKPTTFMNNSGLAVGYAIKKHKLSAQDCVIIYDDI